MIVERLATMFFLTGAPFRKFLGGQMGSTVHQKIITLYQDIQVYLIADICRVFVTELHRMFAKVD